MKKKVEPHMAEEKRKILYRDYFLSVEEDLRTGHRVVRLTDAVALLLYVPKWDSVIMIVQQRPALESKENPSGTVLEFPAGRVDYDADPYTIAMNEAWEEVGVKIPRERIKAINGGRPLALSGGVLTEKIYLFYAEVLPEEIDMTRTKFGNEDEGEFTKRRLVAVSALPTMRFETTTSMALIQWFLRKRKV